MPPIKKECVPSSNKPRLDVDSGRPQNYRPLGDALMGDGTASRSSPAARSETGGYTKEEISVLR